MSHPAIATIVMLSTAALPSGCSHAAHHEVRTHPTATPTSASVGANVRRRLATARPRLSGPAISARSRRMTASPPSS